jgi:hypothetical protein
MSEGSPSSPSSTIQCRQCKHENVHDAVTCSSCGGILPTPELVPAPDVSPESFPWKSFIFGSLFLTGAAIFAWLAWQSSKTGELADAATLERSEIPEASIAPSVEVTHPSFAQDSLEKLRDYSLNPEKHLPMPLERAMQADLVHVRVSNVNFDSCKMRFRFSLRRPVGQAIRMMPGWRIFNPDTGGELITTGGTLLEFNGREPIEREIPVVRSRMDTVTSNHLLEKLSDSHAITKFLVKVSQENETPDWSALQIAVWMLSINIDLDTLMKQKYTTRSGKSPLGISHPVAPSVQSVDDAFRLLEKAEYHINPFQLYQDVEKTLALAIADYKNLQNDVQTIEILGYFRTRPEAENILLQVFSQHGSTEGLLMRKAAFKALIESLSDNKQVNQTQFRKILGILTRALEGEKDEWLKQDIKAQLDKVLTS